MLGDQGYKDEQDTDPGHRGYQNLIESMKKPVILTEPPVVSYSSGIILSLREEILPSLESERSLVSILLNGS